MKLKKSLAGVGAAATLFGASALIAAPAIAQDGGGDTADDTTVDRPYRHRHAGAETVAQVLGIDADELGERLRSGETVADIAAAEDVPLDDVITALVDAAIERLDAAVEAERLTQDEADDRLVEIEEHITAFVNGEAELRGPRGHGGPRGFGTGAVLELLGLDADELRGRLQDGATLAEIAAEEGVSVDELADAMTAPLVERLDAAVADDRLTADEAADRLDAIEEKVDAMINGELPTRGPSFGRGPDRGFGPSGAEGFGPGPTGASEGTGG